MATILRNLPFKKSFKGTKTPVPPKSEDNAKTGKHTSKADRTPFALGDFPIDAPRPLRVIIVGAGHSGICAGIRFLQHVPNVEVVIYEKNEGVGGTWWMNRYPGLACDVPSHCYQFSFFQHTQWSSFYAPGPEILAYLDQVINTYGLEPYIKLQHEMVGAKWNDNQGKWHVSVKRPKPGPSAEFETFEDIADVLFTGLGIFGRWEWPNIEGLHDFQGTLVHSANWNVGASDNGAVTAAEDVSKPNKENGYTTQVKAKGTTWQEDTKDWADKKVAVIGVGSSAIQMVPALQPRVGKLYNYVRGKTWLATPFGGPKLAELLNRDPDSEDYTFTAEEKKAFEDPVNYKKFRHALEEQMNSVHDFELRNTEMQKSVREIFQANMTKRLAKKPWILDHLLPDFGPGCRRLTPGPGYLEALCEDNVDFISTHIKKVTKTGIETVDGRHQELDIIVCATGFDTSFSYPFPIIGRNGVDIRDKWSPFPKTYLAMCVDEFPNWFFSFGPNTGLSSGSLLGMIEYQVNYAVLATLKLQRERLKSIEVKKDALEDFDEYLEHYFPTTVYSEKCRSWYKVGKEEGRIVGLWPGSGAHILRALQHPRWEDFKYEPLDGQRNRMHWLGNGMTLNEQTMSGNRAWYLADDVIDYPPVPLFPRQPM